MASYYADSSALVKRHILEAGSLWFSRLAAPSAGHTIATARVTVVEVYSALNRLVREGKLSPADYTVVVSDFESLVSTEYQMVELTLPLIERARLLLESHPLRAYDAVQLASALKINDALLQHGRAGLTFLSADQRLLAAAQAEGLLTDDPNLHP